ncbi:MAG: sialidase family protein [Terriglobia bacterium]
MEHSTIAAVPKDNKPSWMGSEGPNEGSIVRLADGRIYAVYRTGGKDGMIGNAWSSDDGKTWTAPASIGFMGVAPRIHRLRNNMLAMSTGRPGPVAIWFNLDGNGENWSHATPLFAGMSTRYTDLIEVQPGKLLIVYDSVPYGWYNIPFADRKSKNTIYGTFVEVRRE